MSPDSLRAHVTAIATRFHSRNYEHPQVLSDAALYVEHQFAQMGLQAERQTYTLAHVAPSQPFHNLVVRLGPDTSEVMVIGAHYDVAGDHPGADDNASGVAGLLELARLLKDLPLTQRLELVVYTNEEPPFFRSADMGSAVHAKALQAAGKKVSLMLALECIGYFSDAPGSQTFPLPGLGWLYPHAGHFIALVGYFKDSEITRQIKQSMATATPLAVHSINAPEFVHGIDFSDHLNYAAYGAPALMVTDTAFFRNFNYHTEGDTPERLDYARMAMVVGGVEAVVRKFAGAKTPAN